MHPFSAGPDPSYTNALKVTWSLGLGGTQTIGSPTSWILKESMKIFH